MIIRCGGVGEGGLGGHTHCDALSFELAVGNQTFIRDPGTYLYTSYPKKRNLFRSTAYHNTVVVDNKEINEFNENNIFIMKNNASPKINNWEKKSHYILFDAEHYGYKRLDDPVIHRRKICYDKRKKYWIIQDIMSANMKHRYDIYFHFDSQVKIINKGHLKLIIHSKNKDIHNLSIIFNNDEASLSLDDGWLAYQYGSKVKAPVAKYSMIKKGRVEFETYLFPDKN